MVYITSLPYMNAVARKAYLPKEVIIPDPENPGKMKTAFYVKDRRPICSTHEDVILLINLM